MSEGKEHVGIVIVGHVDAGKSTTTGHLLFELGGISDRDLEKLKAEADAVGKGSFLYAFFTDRQKDERERGVTISCTTKEFFTDTKHYTIIDAPGHRDFIKNMITGSSQADVALLMVPATMGGFETAIAKGNRKTGEVEGQTRQHARLCNLLGIEQIIIGVNKMDDKSVNFSEERYEEIKKEVAGMVSKAGYKKKMEEIPIIPMSGFLGLNLTKVADKEMPWYKGFSVTKNGKTITGKTLVDALDNVVSLPKRESTKPFRMPVSGVHKIRGVGDVITGRIEQGSLKPGQVLRFMPTDTTGKAFSIEMHHKNVELAGAGDNVGINVKGLNKEKMPKVGDIIYIDGDAPKKATKEFKAMVQVQDHPGKLKPSTDDGKGGFTPSVHIRTAKCACRLSKIHWKMGKETGKKKVENPPHLITGDTAEVTFVPTRPFIVDTFKQCPGLGRVAVMDSNSLIMLGKVTEVTEKE